MNKQRSWSHSILRRLAATAVSISLAAALVCPAGAASSSSIQNQIDELEQQQSDIQSRQDELEADIAAKEEQTQGVVAQKADLDQQIELTQEEIDNQTALIQQYNLLIAEKQSELDASLEEQAQLNEQYQERLRAMEENGDVSYWSILFKADSFSDLLDRIDMIQEIASADQEMLQQLEEVAQRISDERADLETQREALEQTQAELDAAQAELEQKRDESDALIQQLVSDKATLEAEAEEIAALEESLIAQIAAKEQEYNNALAAEEAAQNNNNSGNGGNTGGTGSGGAPSSSGFALPLPAGSYYISCPYGYRTHPVTGKPNNFHTGVDMAAPAGTPIYATKSGTVTGAGYNSAYGNNVVINHGDGFSSLYGHMTRYVVSVGQQVSQGQLIGYVGSTGISTGNHLHFTIFYNGATVNPMNYL